MRLRSRARSALVALSLAAAAGPAFADDVVAYQALGSAPSSDADPRTHALDVAFAAAVTEAVADLAGAGARTQADAVERDIIRRARKFVTAFSVGEQRTSGGELVLEVTVKIDRDKLRARLTELGVPLATVASGPVAPRVARRRATVLLQVIGLGRPRATFGAAATEDLPGREAIGLALDRAGYAVVSASAAGPAPDATPGLPVDDVGARALAADAHAEVAVVVGIAVDDAGPVRGLADWAAPAQAEVRVLDVGTGKVLASARLASGAVGKADRERLPVAAADAAAAAVIAAGLGLASAAAAPAAIEDGPALTAARGVTVRVRGAAPWPAVTAVRASLAGLPGDPRVTYAAVARGQVALSVDGLTAARIAGHLRTAAGLDAAVRVVGDTVEVVARSGP
jgi:hypothetical protein